LLRGCCVGHAPLGTHWPLQTCKGSAHLHWVGLFGGKGVNPSMHSNAHLLEPQIGLEWSGKRQLSLAADSFICGGDDNDESDQANLAAS